MKSVLSVFTEDKELHPSIVGDGCIIGTGAVIYRVQHNWLEEGWVADMASIREDVTVGDQTIIGRGVAVDNKVYYRQELQNLVLKPI